MSANTVAEGWAGRELPSAAANRRLDGRIRQAGGGARGQCDARGSRHM